MSTAENQIQDDIKERALSVPEQARAMKIIDDSSYQKGGQLLLTIKALRKEINETFDPIIAKAYAAHKEAKAQKTKVEEPLVRAECIIKPAMAEYDTKLEQQRLAEQRRLEEEARKKAEEEKLADAIHAEQQGDKETAESIINEPAQVIPIVQKVEKQKISGISFRENWSAQVVNLMALVKAVAAGEQPITYLQANQTSLNQIARAQKTAMSVPGVRAVCEKITNAARR
jgi:hypothetical protein